MADIHEENEYFCPKQSERYDCKGKNRAITGRVT